jgi:uncharacterized protein (TIGR03435 family)
MRGGPGTDDPGRITYENYPISWLIMDAYSAERWQLEGPNWLINDYLPGSPRVDLIAKMPGGTTKEEFRLMLQNLLEERFAIALHRARKEMGAYYLKEVKNGSKLALSSKRASPEGDATPKKSAAAKADPASDGFPVLPSGVSMVATGDRNRMRATNESMDAFALKLTKRMGRPVINATRLQGEYDFDLYWSSADVSVGAEAGPTLLQALQRQLGLTLEPAKGQVDVLVIDHVEKIPTAN